jgi:hypothetical protein
MSQQFQGQYGPQQPPFQSPKKPGLGWKAKTGIGVGILVLGIVIGAAPGEGSTTDTSSGSQPTSQPTVTKSVPGPETTKTATETVTQVPQACLDAIDNAETGFTYAGEAMEAAGNLDADGIEAATAKLNKVAPKWQANKELCRAAGEK